MSETVVGTREEILAAAGRIPSEASDAEVGAAVGALLQLGPKVVVEKRGHRGARVHPAGDEPTDVPGFRVDVQNTLGAGDAFAAGLVYGCLQGWEWPRAARFGNACGAIVVGRHGCSASCPTREEVTEFVRRQGGL
jgi:5-dehydro-2-deoxygluconokinase